MSGDLTRALDSSLRAAPPDKRDQAAAQLAREYAAAIDLETIDRLGPKLLNVLSALGLTPAGRNAPAARGGASDAPGEPEPAADALGQLRQRARARQDRAAAVDAAAG